MHRLTVSGQRMGPVDRMDDSNGGGGNTSSRTGNRRSTQATHIRICCLILTEHVFSHMTLSSKEAKQNEEEQWSDPLTLSTDQIHWSGPLTRSIDPIHRSEPLIRPIDPIH